MPQAVHVPRSQPPADRATEAVQRRFSHAEAAGRWNDLYAGDTDSLEEANYRRRRDLAVAKVLEVTAAAVAGLRVLDLGCGTAPVLTELRRRGMSVAGVDCSADMLALARERLRAEGLEDGGLIQGDCRSTGLATGSFDVVVCLGVISYVEDYRPILVEIHRLLKPGGTVLLSFRNLFNPLLSDPVALARRGLKRLLPRPPAMARPFEIGRSLDHRVVAGKMAALGFQRIGFHGIGFGPYRLAGRPLLSERRAIRVSRWLETRLGHLRTPQLWLADVNLTIYRKA